MTKDMINIAIIVVFLSTALAQDPIVNITGTEPGTIKKTTIIEGYRDQDVTLDCLVENLQPGTYVRWQKVYQGEKREEVEKVSVDEASEDNTKYSIEKPKRYTWRLRIKSVQPASEGRYVCWVGTTQDSKRTSFRDLRVVLPPNLIEGRTSSDTTVTAGDTIDLDCNSEGIPTPAIVWRRPGGKRLPGGRGEEFTGTRLTLSNIQPEDRGYYICRAENNVGAPAIRRIYMDVKFKPKILTPNVEVYQAPGYVIELQCLIEANPFPSEEQRAWIKGARKITNTNENMKVKTLKGAFNQLTYELVISPVTKEDYGEYRCRVTNREGTSYGSIQLIRSETPQKSIKFGMVLTAGSSAILFSITTMVMCLATVWL